MIYKNGCVPNFKYQHLTFFINGVFDNYDPDDINYFGNYIHPKVKQLLGNKDTWKQIKNYRNLFAHPHEKINERALKMVCEIITSDKFIHSIEKSCLSITAVITSRTTKTL